MCQSVPKVELERVKNQLKSSLVMALESWAVEVKDLCRKLPVYSRNTPDCVRHVATRLFTPSSGHRATILMIGRGDLQGYRRLEGDISKYGVPGA
ncbi:hypothetical protein DFH29DRAFT_816489 [Suillus ampliporus]|nr:hypothetical protein DFH29DRAFT_816489 [Suillus ampliporus]